LGGIKIKNVKSGEGGRRSKITIGKRNGVVWVFRGGREHGSDWHKKKKKLCAIERTGSWANLITQGKK